jgi:CRP-like cAMP-binding protein
VIRLLEHDAELGARMSDARRDAALRAAVAPVVQVASGPVSEAALTEAGHGLLVVEGMLTCIATLGERSVCEVLGPGDVVWRAVCEEPAHGPRTTWAAHGDGVILARLQRDAVHAMARFPELGLAFFERAERRHRALLRQMAVSHVRRLDERLELALWLLAERHGRAVPEGMLVDLPLTHHLLADIAGARRPSVSVALARLARHGRVVRDAQARFVLTADRPPPAP